MWFHIWILFRLNKRNFLRLGLRRGLKAIAHNKMNLRLVWIDPHKSEVARLIHEYGQEKFSEGLWTGGIYAGLTFIFLLCLREFMRSS
jgi:hypothetical protein